MSTNLLCVVGIAVFSFIILGSGFWLTRSGKPYNQILFNIHKLIALAAVILFVITLFQVNRVTTLNALQVVAGVVTGLIFVGLFVTGALVSIDKPVHNIVFTLHHILPYLALLTAAASRYLWMRKA